MALVSDIKWKLQCLMLLTYQSSLVQFLVNNQDDDIHISSSPLFSLLKHLHFISEIQERTNQCKEI